MKQRIRALRALATLEAVILSLTLPVSSCANRHEQRETRKMVIEQRRSERLGEKNALQILAQADSLFQQGAYPAALECYTAVRQDSPSLIDEADVGIGKILMLNQEYGQAIPFLEEAIKIRKKEKSFYLQPAFFSLYDLLGASHSRLGQQEKARAVYAKGMQTYKDENIFEPGAQELFQCRIAGSYLEEKRAKNAFELLYPLAGKGKESYYGLALSTLAFEVRPALIAGKDEKKTGQIDDLLQRYFPTVFPQGANRPLELTSEKELRIREIIDRDMMQR
ncbi:MAG: hypothetical protein V1743_02995 [Nanoarchaeota archaeon]